MHLNLSEAHLRRRGAVGVLVRRHRFSSGNQVARGTLFHVAQRVADRICRRRGGCVGSRGGSRGLGSLRDERCWKNGASNQENTGSVLHRQGSNERGLDFAPISAEALASSRLSLAP